MNTKENIIKEALETLRVSKPKITITTFPKKQDYRKLIAIIKSVVPQYKYPVKGIHYLSGNPVMLNIWI
jgi:hypothetical protein